MDPEVDLVGLGDNELIATLASLRKEQRLIARSVGLLEMEIRRRAKESGATVIMTDAYTVTLKPVREYKWDVPRFKREASKFFSAADLDRIITRAEPKPPEEKIATAKVLPLARRLGTSVEKAVMACADVIDGDPKVEIEEIDEGDRPL